MISVFRRKVGDDTGVGKAESGLSSDLLAMVVATVFVSLMTLASYKLIAVLDSPVQLAQYTTDRRIVSFIVPLLALGYGVTLPLWVSQSASLKNGMSMFAENLLIATALFILAVTSVVFASDDLVGRIFPGGRNAACAVLLCSWSLNVNAMLFGVFRGLSQFPKAALLTASANGAAPVVVIVFFHFNFTTMWLVWAISNVVVVLMVLSRLKVFRHLKFSISLRRIGVSAARVPGDLAFASLFLLPVIAASAVDDPADRAVFNYGFVLVGMVIAISGPLNVVLLPRVGALTVAPKSARALRSLALRALGFGLLVGVAAGACVSLGAKLIITTLLDSQYSSSYASLAGLGPALAFVAVFLFVRSVLDGLSSFPVSPLLCIFALAGYLLLSHRANDIAGLTSAVVVAFGILGAGAVLAVGVMLPRRDVVTE